MAEYEQQIKQLVTVESSLEMPVSNSRMSSAWACIDSDIPVHFLNTLIGWNET